MTLPNLLGFTFLALVFFVGGVLARGASLWSNGSGATIGWLCHAIALALAVVGTTSLLCQCSPDRIPPLAARRVSGTIGGIAALGLVIDNFGRYTQRSTWIGVAELIGFAVILVALFEAARRSAEQRSN